VSYLAAFVVAEIKMNCEVAQRSFGRSAIFFERVGGTDRTEVCPCADADDDQREKQMNISVTDKPGAHDED
jgi:hypothetical protein